MNVGDLVVLKCGGPVMVVSGFTKIPQERIVCVWFSTLNEKQEGLFLGELLESLDHMVCGSCGAKIQPLEEPEPEPRVFLGSKRKRR